MTTGEEPPTGPRDDGGNENSAGKGDTQPAEEHAETETGAETGAETGTASDAGTVSDAGTTRGLRRLVPAGRRARSVLVVALVLVLVLSGSALWLGSGRSLAGLQSGQGVLSFLPVRLPGGVAFEAGGRRVTETELEQRIEVLGALYGITPPEEEAERDRFRRDTAKSYAVSLILEREADERDIAVSGKEARDTLTSFIEQELGEGQEAYNQFIDTLGQEGATEQAVLDEITRQLELGELFNTVTEDHRQVGRQRLEEAFQQRRDELGVPQTREIRNIVVDSEAAAEDVIAQLESGADFAELARESSLDGSTREDGGDLGRLSKDQLEKEYGQAAFSAEEGEVFGPVHNDYGWNVGRVDNVHPAEEATFDEVAEDLRAQLQNEQTLSAWRDWLAERIRAADVVYADQYRPDDPDAPPNLEPGPGDQQRVQPRQPDPDGE
ncbi:peptidylprolyl isomerase [Haloechinothrix sp. YIM 98757]|uniref:Peptidylprolyl isomerase n=1 Tax=Haloechinothrix aidingensis TaxID=2752311 RepID=A0A838AB76_9PSEU|nr:peptidylprolyl isomerase [Haloechinothrix aidingensis]MBA0126494.1 peptidylprolyl isomerase [Haloechinothrix aidingensis]